MKLSTIVQAKSDKTLEETLLKMTCFFHQFMFDGSQEDENDPSLISNEDYRALEALVDKIEHMVKRIGCPNSVEPMLWSIASRKIKYWQACDTITEKGNPKTKIKEKNGRSYVETTYPNWFGKGKQLKSREDKARVFKTDGYYHTPQKQRILKGHFRWNNTGYILSRPATDALQIFLETEF